MFDEFEEVVARCFHCREWLPMHKAKGGKGGTDDHAAQTLEQCFDTWLKDMFVPLALKAIDKKKHRLKV